jgi:hypothetical protein
MALPVSDNFNRADSNPIGGNWTTFPGLSPIQIVSNQAYGADDSSNSAAYWNADTFNNDQWAQCTVLTVTGAGVMMGPAVRCSTSQLTGYVLNISNGSVNLFKCVNGTPSLVASYNATISNGSVFKLIAHGTTIEVWMNGNLIISATDSDISSGSAGIVANSQWSSLGCEDWSAGNYAAAVKISRSRLVNSGNGGAGSRANLTSGGG